jgi:hypothetical protein
MVLRGVQHESEVLLRQVDGRLMTLRIRQGSVAADLERAEQVAEHLRRLVHQTARASAADRARVRAAVHYFVGLRNTRERRPGRTLREDLRVVGHMVDLPEAHAVTPAAAEALA